MPISWDCDWATRETFSAQDERLRKEQGLPPEVAKENTIDPSTILPVTNWGGRDAAKAMTELIAALSLIEAQKREINRLRIILAEIADAVAAQRVDGLDRQSWIEQRCLGVLKH